MIGNTEQGNEVKMDKNTYAEKTNKILETLPEYCQDFIYGKGTETAYSTMYEYSKDISYFLDWIILNHKDFDELKKENISISDLDNITSDDINNFLVTLGKNLEKKTLARKKATLSVLFSYLCEKKGLKKNPIAGSSKVKLEEKELVYLTDDEQKAFLDCVYHGTGMTNRQLKHHEHYKLRDYVLYSLLLDTGLRVSELTGISIKDVDIEEFSVCVLRKGGKVETVYYSDLVAELLDMLVSKRKAEGALEKDPLFVSSSGERISVRMVEVMTKKYAMLSVPKKADKISPHKMRSSFAMTLYRKSDNNLLLVQKRLSHKNITTTNIYAKAAKDEIKNSRNLNAEGKDINPFA